MPFKTSLSSFFISLLILGMVPAFQGVFQNRDEAKGMAIAHKKTNAFPSNPVIFRALFLEMMAAAIPIIGRTAVIAIAGFVRKSSHKIKDIRKAAIDTLQCTS